MSWLLRWGILGTGNIARQFCAGMVESKRGIVAAVGSRDLATARAFAETFGIPAAFGCYDDLIGSSEVDAIYLTLPNSLHCRWTIAALRAGKHVLCEKPISASAAEAETMFHAAERAERVLVEAFMYRSHPLTLAVEQAVRAGAIGELKLIRTSFCFRTLRVGGNIRFDRELAGGALMDVGCYCVNFSRFFAGAEPTMIHATGKVHESRVDELAAGIMLFPGAICASFACGMRLQADNLAQLCGSEGFIEIPIPWKPPPRGAIWRIGRARRRGWTRRATCRRDPRHSRHRRNSSRSIAKKTCMRWRLTISRRPRWIGNPRASAGSIRSATCGCWTSCVNRFKVLREQDCFFYWFQCIRQPVRFLIGPIRLMRGIIRARDCEIFPLAIYNCPD